MKVWKLNKLAKVVLPYIVPNKKKKKKEKKEEGNFDFHLTNCH